MSSLLFFCKNSKAVTAHMLACKKCIIDAELFGQKDFLMNSGNVWWVWLQKKKKNTQKHTIGLQRKPNAHIKTVKTGL